MWGPRVLYGYRFGEVPLPELPEIRSDTQIRPRQYQDVSRRMPVQVDLGARMEGMSMPHPDTSHGPTVAAGLAKRVCAQLATPDPIALLEARDFVRELFKRTFKPLEADADLSVESWLEASNYPAWRKEELATVERFFAGALPRKLYEFKSFVKSENYEEYKHARTIQAPTDEAKVHFGPAVAACEHVAFQHRAFIKKVPVADRPAYIMNMFEPGVKVAASDFSSFEVSWQRAQMEAFEIPFFEHMLQQIPGARELLRELRSMELGEVKLIFKWVTAYITSTRKSGTMNTSLSNGVGNWAIHEYAAHRLNLGKLTGVFEGDDGLFYYSSGRFPTKEFYESLGFSVKLDIWSTIADASFCGMIFDPEEQVAVWDPRDFLVRLGWGSGRYARAKDTTKWTLLRCKAMSLAAQAPRAPVLAECAAWILRCTSGYDTRKIMESRNLTWWERQKYLQGSRTVDTRECGPATRSLVERKFGIPVATQLAMEEWFRHQTTITAIPKFFHNSVWEKNCELYERHLSVPLLDARPFFPDQPLVYPHMVTHEAGPQLLLLRQGLNAVRAALNRGDLIGLRAEPEPGNNPDGE